MNLINNSSDEALEKLYIDPFNNSPYLDSNKIINKQKIDHFVYLSYIHPEKKELINKLEENIKEINIDLPFLKESLYKIHELNLLSFFEQFIDYKAIKETDQDGLMDGLLEQFSELLKKGDLYEIIKKLISYSNNLIKKIDVNNHEFVYKFKDQERIKNLINLAAGEWSDELIATLRQNFLDHKEFLKSATDKYDISLRVFELLSYLTLLHEYVLLLPESNKKEIIKSRYHYLEMIYFNYQRLSYYIKGFIDYEIATNDHIMNGLNSKIKIDFDFTPLHVNHNLYLKAYQYIIQIGNFKAQCEKEIFENS